MFRGEDRSNILSLVIQSSYLMYLYVTNSQGSCAKFSVARQRKKKEGLASLLDFADENEIEYVKRECFRGEVKKEMKNKCIEKVEIEKPADGKGTKLKSNGSFYDTQTCMCGQDLCNSGTQFTFHKLIATTFLAISYIFN